ncbi:hypothetical protein GCM10010193_34170 [Kitasatospora atroaurantiaca]|uniref:Uncharacterized protein n=1 Tax=Kitasatospora atroaurantiaca TaxID=285545 RepID=A0A561ENU1_9ACTN|nr:hypothetical protein [Kitasatospora atroaurantiaca]TWE17270.1 hypothetical protein FB465_2278 [Kitasatospora atroaurantiaca]
MTHQLRAEYGPAGRSGGARMWHVVRNAAPNTGLCGRELDPDAESKPEEDWGTGLRACQQCGSLYMHEVPHLPADHF